MDLDKYFARIGYSGPRTPTLETLDALTEAHTRTIPFENLDVLLGRLIDVSTEAIFDKLVVRRRGGYCFEQNGLLLAVLLELGFDARPLSARVRIDRPRDFTPARTHVFVRVEIAGVSWLTDVGVGALSLTRSLRLFEEGAQVTPHETRRIVREEGRYFHQARLGDTWSDVCEFTLEEMPLIDREVANHFTSTHPRSHFKDRLMVARAGEEGTRVVLLNDTLKVRGRDGHAEVTALTSAGALLSLLRDRFGIALPPETRFNGFGAAWSA